MNTKQQNALRSLLKKYEYKNASTIVRQGMGINFENLLQKGDALYIIPRIASCYAEEDKRKKLMGTVYKEWLKDVVERRWVKSLDPYIDEHGGRPVLQAIYYLMDNGLWDTYEGRLSLDERDRDYYRLQDMPSAIAKVKEINPEYEKKEEIVEPREEASPAVAPESVMSAEDAVKCANGADIAIETLIDHIHKMTEYVRTAADTDGLREKIAEQQKQMEDLRAKLEEANKTMLKASDFISKQKETIADMERNYDILNEKYNKALDERDAADRDLEACKKLLEEESQKERMPKKKVIPQSEIEGVPLLGRGVMKGLVPVLAKYNVTLDPNR